jgi:hypothetical protein
VRYGLIILSLFVTGSSLFAQLSLGKLSISKHVKDTFFLAAGKVDTSGNHSRSVLGPAAVYRVYEMGDMEDFILPGEDFYMDMPCQCMFKNDTLTVVSGVAYENGFILVARGAEEKSRVSLELDVKEQRWKMNDTVYTDEIEIPSLKNNLTISHPFPLKHDQRIYGFFEMESLSLTVLKEEGKEEKQHYRIKIYFTCQVYPEIF